MESLYRKYRPQTFADVVGQRHVVGTLEHAVLEGRTSHAYLFCGPRGTGKTTMARLLAKALMCEEGAGHLPDGTCAQCQAIANGEHPDVYELDAASRTGVDNVREEIITRVDYAPVMGRYKVYIIDEVHMLTQAAFNALLKTLEEPPSHVVFVLCTTDPERVPATIQSRVQRFDFRALSDEEIRGQLVSVCEQEGFAYDAEAVDMICRHARGGMRDALSTLEQLSVFGAGTISTDAARDLLGSSKSTVLESLSLALAHRDTEALFTGVAELVASGRDLLQFTREFASHIRDVYVVSAVGARCGVVNAEGEELERISSEAEAFASPDRVAHALTVLTDAALNMRTSPDRRLLLEVALTKIARPESDLTLEALASRIAALESGAREAAPTTAPTPAPTPAPAPKPASVPAPQPAPAPRSAASAPQPVPRPAPQPAQRPVPAPAPQPVPAPSASQGDLESKWQKVLTQLRERSAQYGALLLNAIPAEDNGTQLVVKLPENSSFAMLMLGRKDVSTTIQSIVDSVFGHRIVQYREDSGVSVNPAPMVAPAAAPEPAPQPVPATRPEPRPAPAPAPTPQPAPVPRPVQQPAPVPEPAPQPAPAPVTQPEPRRVPDPAPVYAPEDDYVPYDDADIPPFDEVPFEGSASVEPVGMEPMDLGVGPVVTHTYEDETIVEDPSPAIEDSAEPSPSPAETSAVPQAAKPARKREHEPEDVIPAGLTAMLEDVFGEPVPIIRTSAKTEPESELIGDAEDYLGDAASDFDMGLDGGIEAIEALEDEDDEDDE